MIQSWNCPICKAYNDILTNHCKSCKSDKPDFITFEYQALVRIKRGIFVGSSDYQSELLVIKQERGETLTEQEEMFAKFFSQEKLLVRDMDIEQLRAHRSELQSIAFEAKARLAAADDEQKDRNKGNKNKQFVLSDNDQQTTSDAINTPKIRAARMTKIDKMREDLSKYLDKATVDEMIRKMEKKATEQTVNTTKFTLVKSPVEQAVETAKDNGTITDAEVKPNPFAQFAKKA